MSLFQLFVSSAPQKSFFSTANQGASAVALALQEKIAFLSSRLYTAIWGFTWSSTLLLLLFSFFIRGMMNPKNDEKENVRFLLLFLAVPFAVFFILLFRVLSVYPSNVYVIYTIPAFFILAAKGISGLAQTLGC